MDDDRVWRWADVVALLQAEPDARLNAVDELALFVPLPAAMQGTGHVQLLGRSGMESIEPEDHTAVIHAWQRMLDTGHSSSDVHDRNDPWHVTRLEFFDLRPELGVVAAVAYATALRPGVDRAHLVQEDDRPRLGRVRKDARAVILSADQGAERMLGAGPGGLVGLEARDLVHPDDQELAVKTWVAMLSRPGSQERVRLRQRRTDGSWLWIEVTNSNRLQDPDHGCVVCDLVDVSLEMGFREDVRARERLLQRLTQALPVGVVQLSSAGMVVYSNERLHEVLGTPARSSLDALVEALRPGDQARLLASFGAAVATGLDDDLQVEVSGAGTQRVLEVALRPLVDDDGAPEGVLVCVNDITEAVRLRAELEQRATHDVLTGCLNRGAVLHRLEEELARVSTGLGCAVLFLDLDGFKKVNDTRGHAAGDELLREVAAVLRSAARTGDAVGRLGGDEFVLVCPRITSAELALALAVDVQARLRRSHSSEIPAWGASAGVAWVDDPALDAETALARADAAMYAAKQDRRQVAVLWSDPAGNQNVIGRQPRGHPYEARSSTTRPPAGRT